MTDTLQPTREGDCTFSYDAPFRLEGGGALQPVSVRYAVYGELNERRDNAVLVCHALSGSARVADWWPEMFGQRLRPLARLRHLHQHSRLVLWLERAQLRSIRRPGKPFGPDFPLVTIRDIVRAQAHVLDELGVKRLRTVIGASIGGMQALQWAVDYPDRVEHCIAIGSAPLSAMGLALNHLQRKAIQLDPDFQDGRYAAEPATGAGHGAGAGDRHVLVQVAGAV